MTGESYEHVTKVGIRPKVSMLSVLSRLNYKAWFAVAEFVDNSVQSYFANRRQLQRLHGDSFVLKVVIRLDAASRLIEITDNAAGIQGRDFPRAFRPAEVPPDRSGLSEFGMGMKTAACWFTNTWSVRTKALGEPVERTVRFDIHDILEANLDDLNVQETRANPSSHYTVVRLENLGKKFPQTKTQKKLRDHLASIYRVYIRTGEVELYFGDDNSRLTYEEPESLVAPPHNAPNSLPVQWRKEINFDLPGGRRVWGFAALRREASTSHAGFALFRRNRLIVGSDDETYRPHEVFGNTNSYRYQRLFGELHVEGFEVSHTKDGFSWDEYEEEFLESLRDHLEAEPLNLLRQAEQYRARPSKTALQPLLNAASRSLALDMEERGGPALSGDANSEGPSDEGFIQEPGPTDDAAAPLVATEKTFSVLVDGAVWNVAVRTLVDPAITDWLKVGKTERSQLGQLPVNDVAIDVSMAHPFVQQFIGPRNENAELFLRFAVGVALAAVKASRGGYPSAPMLSRMNRLLRESLTGDSE